MHHHRPAGRPHVANVPPDLTAEEALILIELIDQCRAKLWRRFGDEILEILVDTSPAELDDEGDAGP